MKCQNSLDPFFRAVYNEAAKECFAILYAKIPRRDVGDMSYVKEAAELAYTAAFIFADEYMERNFMP
jgi:hypothetical protein